MNSRRLLCALLPVFAGCSPLLGLDQDFYVAAGGKAGVSGSANAAGSEAGTGGSATSGAGGTAGTVDVGGAGSAGVLVNAGASASEPPEALPSGLIAYHRYTKYSNGDAEAYLVDLPVGTVSPELGKLFQVCGALSPAFSPDGKRLVVSARPWSDPCPTGEAHRNELEIYVLNIDDLAHPTKLRVTQNTVPDEDPSFSPSGDFVLIKHDDDIVKLVLDEQAMPYGNCDKIKPPSYCFTQPEEQLRPVMSSDGLVFFQQGTENNADIFYFDLADAENTLTLSPKPAAARSGAYEARPSIFGPWLYFIQWRGKNDPADRVARKPLAALNQAETSSAFEDLPLNDYTDPGGMSADLVLFASEEGAGGGHDLFVGDFTAGWRSSLDRWVPGINSSVDELSPVFWPRPAK